MSDQEPTPRANPTPVLPRAEGAPVAHHLRHATARTWPGTPDLVARLIHESKWAAAWRPIRAAAMLVQADLEPRVWMHPAEFKSWRSDCRAIERRRGREFSIQGALGIGYERSTAYSKGKAPIPKPIALACAHTFWGLELPISPDDPEAFSDWFTREFGTTRGIAAWLDIGEKRLTDRMRGFRLHEDERIPITPDVGLVRALDWVVRCGPYCPYGERAPVEVFPRPQ